VVVDVVQMLDGESLVRALQHAGAATRLSRSELLRTYEGGAENFDADFREFRDRAPLTAGQSGPALGARLLLVCAEVDPQVMDAVAFLRQPGRQVEVLQLGVVRGADGRRFVDVSPLLLHQPVRRAVEPASLRLLRSNDAFAEAMAYDAERSARSRVPYRELASPTDEPTAPPTAAPAPPTAAPAPAVAAPAAMSAAARSTRSVGSMPMTSILSAVSERAAGRVTASGETSGDSQYSPSAPMPAHSAAPSVVAAVQFFAGAAGHVPSDASARGSAQSGAVGESARVHTPLSAPMPMLSPSGHAYGRPWSEPTPSVRPATATAPPARPATASAPMVRPPSGAGASHGSRAPVTAPTPAPASALDTGGLPDMSWTSAADFLPGPRALPELASLVKGRGAVATLVWFRERRGQRLVATLRHDGLIELPDGRVHASPDDAAADAANAEGSVDGWNAWRIGDGGPTLAEAAGIR